MIHQRGNRGFVTGEKLISLHEIAVSDIDHMTDVFGWFLSELSFDAVAELLT